MCVRLDDPRKQKPDGVAGVGIEFRWHARLYRRMGRMSRGLRRCLCSGGTIRYPWRSGRWSGKREVCSIIVPDRAGQIE